MDELHKPEVQYGYAKALERAGFDEGDVALAWGIMKSCLADGREFDSELFDVSSAEGEEAVNRLIDAGFVSRDKDGNLVASVPEDEAGRVLSGFDIHSEEEDD
jgi:hypothetical protein